MCVWEDFWEDRREEEEKKEGADTALKIIGPDNPTCYQLL